MRLALILTSGAAWVLLWASPAGALSPDTSCENAKLRAAGAYARCLARAAKHANTTGGDLSDAAIGRCDAHFDRAFARAEANGACRTAGGPATLRGPILGQMDDTFATTTTGPGCPSTPVFDQDTSTYACTLKSGSAIDLAAIVTQIGSGDVTDDTVVWIEAWGANGGPGNTSNGGGGGSGGYAQMTTTVNDMLLFFGISEFHYYLGVNGAGPSANAGGDGGTATLVTLNDLTGELPNLDDILLVAGGGGGGGAGRGTAACGNIDKASVDVLGGAGGAGAQAISFSNTLAFGVGKKGGARRNENYSGSGGGGGYGGGGGGREGDGDSNCVSGGGGGGGSLAQASTQTCVRSRPSSNPGGSRGAVQIVFDAGSCG